MEKVLKYAAVAAITISAARASPLPQGSGITVIGFSPGDAKDICALTYDNPQQTWQNSGASVFLDSEINKLGEDNWVNHLDAVTTGDGTQPSNLDCTDVDNANCLFPTNCLSFTPPALFHVRNAIATAHSIFASIFDNLLAQTVVTGLEVDTIVQDFGPSTASSQASLFGALSGAFGGLSGATAISTPISGALSTISGVLGIIGALLPQENDPTAQLNNQLAQIFTAAQANVQATVETIFGGNGDTSKLPGVTSDVGPNGETTNIAKFFANGKFLIPVTASGQIDSMLAPLFAQSLSHLKQYIVALTLKSQNYWIQAEAKSASDCSAIAGSNLNSAGICFFIAKRLPGAAGGADSIAPLDSSIVNKLTDPSSNYNFDLGQFYGNADQCQSDNPNFDGAFSDPSAGLSNSGNFNLPECFFSIPVIHDLVPCAKIEQGQNVPSNLGFTFDSCQKVTKPGGNGITIGGHGP